MRAQHLFVVAMAALLATTSTQASVEINANPTKNMNCSAGVCAPTAKNAVLNTTDLANMLATSDVKVVTGSGAVTITVSGSFSWTSAHRLTLDANLNVSFRSPVEVAGQGAVTIVTNDGGTGGDYFFTTKGRITFWDTSNNLIINGTTFMLVNDIPSLSKAMKANIGGAFAIAADINGAGRARSTVVPKFSGIFEGLGHTIRNLVIDRHGRKVPGAFFGTTSGTIRDIGLDNVSIVNGSGALAGLNSGTIIASHSSGAVRGQEVGGLVGKNDGLILRCYSSAVVNGELWSGGLVAYNEYGEIVQSFATGTVTGVDYVGGLAGISSGMASAIIQSYATGSVSDSVEDDGEYFGGLVGLFESFPGDGAEIRESFSTGAVVAPPIAGIRIGGLIGVDSASPSVIASAYWDMDTSGITDPSQGAGSPANDPGITGLTDAQLKASLPAGFDPKVWGRSASINNGYPYLLANPPQ